MDDGPEDQGDHGDDSSSRDTAEIVFGDIQLINLVGQMEPNSSSDSMEADNSFLPLPPEELADNDDLVLGSDSEDEVPFDIQLPYQHLYLARKFNALPGLTYLEAGTIVTVPLLPFSLVTGASVLIPGQTIPLNYSPADGYLDVVRALRDSLANGQNLFGFMTRRWLPNNSRKRLAKEELSKVLGVTLEIFEVGEDEDEERGGYPDFCCKARVTHRFRLLETCAQTRGQWLPMRVLILPEVVLESPLCQARGTNPAVSTLRSAGLTRWPDFVYRQYEASCLVDTAKQYCLQLLNDKTVCYASVPDDPVQLSFWILINFPLNDSLRTEVLCLHNALQRLQRLIQYFKVQSHTWTVRCQMCENVIAPMKEVFFMSSTGCSVTYTNPSGYLHETLTLYDVCAGSVLVDVLVSTQYSWFPGYSWQITSCARCRCHVGWLFKSVRKGMVPRKFYGITKRAIILPSSEPVEPVESTSLDVFDDL